MSYYLFPLFLGGIGFAIFKLIKKYQQESRKQKVKVGVLTNELPPIIYGGVSTWILNFLEMFKDDKSVETIPIFLSYLDNDLNSIKEKNYKNIRFIENENDIITVFKDIDVCVNNLWVALDTIKKIVDAYPKIHMISVCHSLIKMEHITNLGSENTENYFEQEITFQYSDYVVLISKAEKEYYESFGYGKYKAKPIVIYNMYKPKYDNIEYAPEIDYSNDDVGYIGRHVPRKRPELPILAVSSSDREDVQVYNMGVDFVKQSNDYWEQMAEDYKENLNIIPFTSDKSIVNRYWNQIGVNCITGIYEPFGYTMCETLDRRMPAIVQNIDGPSEIVEEVQDYVYMYKVDKDMNKDVKEFSKALHTFWETSSKDRKENAEKARVALDKFRPENVKKQWNTLIENCLETDIDVNRFESLLEEYNRKMLSYVPYLNAKI
jgi:glycosyltransferase involved in cell wall biosynthesis